MRAQTERAEGPAFAAQDRPEGPESGDIAALAGALHAQAAQADELADVLLRLRAGAAACDAKAVDAASDDAARVLAALDDRRRELGSRLARAGLASADTSAWPAALASPRATLRRAAERVAYEAAVNQAVLSRSIEAGEAWLQALFGAVSDGPAVYVAGPAMDDAARPALIMDRRA